MPFRDLTLRICALFSHRAAERKLRDELDFHIEMQSRKHILEGVEPAEAARRARAEFGSIELAKEDIRDVTRIRWWEELSRDVQYALRGFRRAPTFAITVIATIAIALGLNTAAFTIFDAYVLRPLEVRDPNSLYDFAWADSHGAEHQLTLHQYEDLRRQRSVFSEVSARRFLFARIDGQPSFIEMVSDNYFQMLGVGAALGRTIVPGDAAGPHVGAIVVLSHAVWKARFGGDSAVVGRTVSIRGVPFQIVGIAREGFGGVENIPRDFWIPMSMMPDVSSGADLYDSSGGELLQTLTRLAPGVRTEQATTALLAWARSATAARPSDKRAAAVHLTSRATPTVLSPPELAVFSPVLVSFGLVLIIACANVANMMLARGMARQREIGIRLSLGAGRGRLVRQLLTESMVLAVPSALLGLAVSRAALDLAGRAILSTIPPAYLVYVRVMPMQSDLRVFAFILAAAAAATLVFGLVPALQATRPGIVHASKGNFGAEHRPSRLRDALVISQVTAAALLLICSSVLLRNSHRMEAIDPGMHTTGALQVSFFGPSHDVAIARLRNSALVEQVAASSGSPLGGSFSAIPMTAANSQTPVLTFCGAVAANYFPLLGIPVLEGRTFTPAEEKAGAPVVVISKATADRFWPGRSPIGEKLMTNGKSTLVFGGRHALAHEITVVGVVRDAATGPIVFGATRPAVYFPISEETPGAGLTIRVRGDEQRTKQILNDDLDRALPGAVDEIHTLNEMIAGSLYGFQAAYWISSAIAAIALLLTLTGVYGVLSYIVTQRSREMGIRLALGATSGGISALILRQSLRLGSVGLAIGMVLALGASRILSHALAFMYMFDSVAYAGGALVVLAACLAAAFIPSRRAARIDPVVMLREE
jgi:predicted permease